MLLCQLLHTDIYPANVTYAGLTNLKKMVASAWIPLAKFLLAACDVPETESKELSNVLNKLTLACHLYKLRLFRMPLSHFTEHFMI